MFDICDFMIRRENIAIRIDDGIFFMEELASNLFYSQNDRFKFKVMPNQQCNNCDVVFYAIKFDDKQTFEISINLPPS